MNSITVQYKGYTAKTYGRSSMSIFNKDGKECCHTGSYNGSGTEDELKSAIDAYIMITSSGAFEKIYNDNSPDVDDF